MMKFKSVISHRLGKLMKEERGVAAVIVAICMVVLLSVTALVVDMGIVYYQRERLQIAVDSAALAAAQKLPNKSAVESTVAYYLEKNGFKDSDVNIEYLDSDKVVKVTNAVDTQTVFANIFNVSDVRSVASASAKMVSKSSGTALPAAFNYQIFHGSTTATFQSSGSTLYVDGSIHTNNKYAFWYSSHGITVNGAMEACNGSNYDQIKGYAFNYVGSHDDHAPYVEMPDFTDTVNALLPSSYDVTYNNYNYTNFSNFTQNVRIKNSVSTGSTEVSGVLKVDGSFNLSGNYFKLNGGVLFVNGDIGFNCNSVTGNGCIVATGNIRFSNSNTSITAGKSVAVCSLNGNIDFNVSNATVHGMLYAPNGRVKCSLSNSDLYGNLIGKEVELYGSGFHIYKNDNGLPLDITTEGSGGQGSALVN